MEVQDSIVELSYDETSSYFDALNQTPSGGAVVYESSLAQLNPVQIDQNFELMSDRPHTISNRSIPNSNQSAVEQSPSSSSNNSLDSQVIKSII